MNYTIKYKESNVDDYGLHFVCKTKDWRSYLGDNGIFLGTDLTYSRIDYFVYKGMKLIFDTRNGYRIGA